MTKVHFRDYRLESACQSSGRHLGYNLCAATLSKCQAHQPLPGLRKCSVCCHPVLMQRSSTHTRSRTSWASTRCSWSACGARCLCAQAAAARWSVRCRSASPWCVASHAASDRCVECPCRSEQRLASPLMINARAQSVLSSHYHARYQTMATAQAQVRKARGTFATRLQ